MFKAVVWKFSLALFALATNASGQCWEWGTFESCETFFGAYGQIINVDCSDCFNPQHKCDKRGGLQKQLSQQLWAIARADAVPAGTGYDSKIDWQTNCFDSWGCAEFCAYVPPSDPYEPGYWKCVYDPATLNPHAIPDDALSGPDCTDMEP